MRLHATFSSGHRIWHADRPALAVPFVVGERLFAPHNVKGPGFVSKTTSKKGTTYSHRFGKRGTFKIICQVHPTSMKTIVKVG